MAFKFPKPPGAVLSPEVLAARQVSVNLERELIFGMVNCYPFYRRMRDVICVWDPERLLHRQDFSVAKYNTLFRVVDFFYLRFDTNQNDLSNLSIPTVILKNIIVDYANKNSVPQEVAQELLDEVDEEVEFTKSLTLESLNALVDGCAFQDWLKRRVLEHAVGSIQARKGLGQLTIEDFKINYENASATVNKLLLRPDKLARPITEFQAPAEGDAAVLIGPGRFLCRGGICILTGPSGIGKSTLAMQLAIGFAYGKEMFGFKPALHLKVLIIQGENDDGDIAEMRDGVLDGLQLKSRDEAEASKILVLRSSGDTSSKFFENIVLPNLRCFKPDLLIIDPVLAFIGGDSRDQAVVGEFLRTYLMKTLIEFNCGCLLVHHTNKPPTSQGKVTWSGNDSYLESGSAEFRNAPRAAITLMPVIDSVFELSVPKRGRRLGWTTDDGQPTTKRYIKQNEGNQLFWKSITDDEVEREKNQQAESKDHDVLEKVFSCIPPVGEESQSETLAKAKLKGVAQKKCREALKKLAEAERIKSIEKPRSGARAEIYYMRVEAPSIPGGGE